MALEGVATMVVATLVMATWLLEVLVGKSWEKKKVDPKKLNKLLPPGDKELLEASEETGAPTDIPKKSWSWWSTLGNVAKEGVKTLGSATGSFLKNTG